MCSHDLSVGGKIIYYKRDRRRGEKNGKIRKSSTWKFDTILKKIERGIMGGSVSASLEDSSNIRVGDTRSVFEYLNATATQAEQG